MKLTLIHPCVGRYKGMKYLRAWQMEPLPLALIAALTPKEVSTAFYDDRLEPIPYDEPTDLVGISIETYTARRAYQIASEFRKRGVKIVMGGFHATLCQEEVLEYADSIVVGPAESVWETLLTDFQNGNMKRVYSCSNDFSGSPVIPDRTIYEGKDYLKITLLEAGRGCRYNCEFCSIQKFFDRKHYQRNLDTVLKEIELLKPRKQLFFFVDDNITANHEYSKTLFRALIPLKIKWVGQSDISITCDDELLGLMVESGCQGVLIGFESLNPDNLKLMNKNINQIKITPEKSIKKIHEAGIIIYGTFLHGYDQDNMEDYDKIVDFCIDNKLFMVGFNHVTPFPGTGLYQRLANENRLLSPHWWLEEKYTYGEIPYKTMLPQEAIENHCRNNRKKFFGPLSLMKRMRNITNIKNGYMFGLYLIINIMLSRDASTRKLIPLGDDEFRGAFLKVGQVGHDSPVPLT